MSEITNEEHAKVLRLEAVLREASGADVLIAKDDDSIAPWVCRGYRGVVPIAAAVGAATGMNLSDLPKVVQQLMAAAGPTPSEPTDELPLLLD